jgi:hypothetical protein
LSKSSIFAKGSSEPNILLTHHLFLTWFILTLIVSSIFSFCDFPKFIHVLLLILSQLPAVRNFQTTAVTRDIDSAAKFIGAGAATVGVAGSGMYNA